MSVQLYICIVRDSVALSVSATALFRIVNLRFLVFSLCRLDLLSVEYDAIGDWSAYF